MSQFLIEELGFTAVALDSSLPESRMVFDYVNGGPAPARLWEDGSTWTMGTFEGTRALVEWMRAWNLDPAHKRKIRLYGMDVVGGNGTWMPALTQVLSYLDRVEPEYRPITQRIQNFATQYNQLESWSALIFVDQIAPTRMR